MIRLENSLLRFHFLTHSFHQASSIEKKVMSMQRANNKIKIEIYLLPEDSIQLNFPKTQTFDISFFFFPRRQKKFFLPAFVTIYIIKTMFSSLLYLPTATTCQSRVAHEYNRTHPEFMTQNNDISLTR